MTYVAPLSADDILALPLDAPEALFGADENSFKPAYRQLVAAWHPDRNRDPRAASVMAHITALHGAGMQKIKAGTWAPPNVLVLKSKTGKKIKIKYARQHAFELGQMYIGDNFVTYCLDPAYGDLAATGLKNIETLTFADDAMREEFGRALPRVKSHFEADDGKHIVVLHKPADTVLLRDIVAHEGGRIPPTHVAWIMRRLHNLTCYLDWAGITHNDFSLDTYFISPEHHYGALLGGWWYAAAPGAQLTALPMRTAGLAPSDVIRNQKADGRVDLELIRAIGRELLGDPGGSTLITDASVPRPLSDWLRLPSSGKPRADYKAFDDDVLPKSFGPRRFVKWNITPTDIYTPR